VLLGEHLGEVLMVEPRVGRLGQADDPQDKTEERQVNGLQSFLDGAAMMFPLDGEATTSIFMGSRGRPVNIWYWKAGNQVQNLFAKGFGTLTRASIQDVTGKGVYAQRHLDGSALSVVEDDREKGPLLTGVGVQCRMREAFLIFIYLN
jgi:hypothetical protein